MIEKTCSDGGKMLKRFIALFFLLNILSAIQCKDNHDYFNKLIACGSIYAISGFFEVSSYVSGNVALSYGNDKLTYSVCGLTSISSFVLSASCFSIPSIMMIYFLYDYILTNPDKYMSTYYYKVRNALIVSLCANSFVCNTAVVLTSISLYNLKHKYGDAQTNLLLASNFAYVSGYTFLGSLFLSAAIIIKHCLYKAYYNGDLNRSTVMMFPYIQSSDFKSFELGLFLKI